MRLMTFNQMEQTGAALYPNEVDEATRSIIREWFQFRYVCDNDRFPVYFHRVMLRDYSRYKELLRIEAGKQGDRGIKTAFDWLVTDYMERYEERDTQREHESVTGNTSRSTNSGTGSSTQGGTTGTAFTGSINFAPGTTIGYDSTTTGTRSGEDSTSAETESLAHTASDSENRAQSLAKSTPVTASYSGSDMNANNQKVGYIKKAPGQGRFEIGHTDESNVLSQDDYDLIKYVGDDFPKPHITNPTSVSDGYTYGGSVGESQGHDESTTTTATESESKDVVTSRTVHGGVDSTSTNNSTTVTHGLTVSTTESSTQTGSTDSETTGTDQGSDKSKMQHTGRGGEVAEILSRAQKYIRSSSAFDWLRGQLETCFIANLDY